MNLEGKAAVVTGSTKGIGRAIAEALVREGVNVCVSARSEDEVERAVAELNEIERGRRPLRARRGDVARRFPRRAGDEFVRRLLLLPRSDPADEAAGRRLHLQH